MSTSIPTQSEKAVNKTTLFVYLFLLTLFFLLLEISFFAQSTSMYLSDFTFVADQLHIPTTVIPAIIFFIGVQLAVHLIYCLLIWLMTLSIADVLQFSKDRTTELGVIIWFLGIATILAANQYYFPNSKFALLTSLVMYKQRVSTVIIVGLSLAWYSLAILAFFGLVKASLKKTWRILLLIVSVILTALLLFYKPAITLPTDAATTDRPNIILIGIDSLRPDFLGFFGHERPAPFLDHFLNQATVFSEAVTPIARTFPSWTSILTGAYPKQNGIRFNLAGQGRASFSYSLPTILRNNGYETLFATDETRFSNIDVNYGFDQVITPPVGLNDFLVGTFNDFPLTNLLVNTSIGKWLFPYSYANRPVYFTYDPNSFLQLLNPMLQRQRTKPMFLAVHFCLPHYPYLYAGMYGEHLNYLERYQASIIRVDKQIRDFFVLLKRYQFLDHAIVVVLSDHGEALGLSGDRITERELFQVDNVKIPQFYPPSLDHEKVNQSVGHGTDVLGLPQYHSLLAFRFYGLERQQARVVPGVVSLVEIKATILELLGIGAKEKKFKQRSLAAIVTGKQKTLTQKTHIFLESDYTPSAIRTVYPETRDVLLEGIQLFQIDPITTRLTVKDSMGEMIIKSKQYADIYGEWMLAIYPINKRTHMPILINLVTGAWTNDLTSAFAQHSPVSSMLVALQRYQG